MGPCLPQHSLARTSPIFDRKGQSKRKRERELPLTFPDQTRPVGITPCFSTLSKILAKELWQNKDNKPKGFYAYGGAAAFLSEKKPNKMNSTAQRPPSASTYLPSPSP